METLKKDINFFGIDIDPILIERAKEHDVTNVVFEHINVVEAKGRERLSEYLRINGRNRFDISFCFSVTMWIHLNGGDKGLIDFIRYVCDVSDVVVVEPQPWKCYRTAVKRMKNVNGEFPFFKQLKIRQNVDDVIECILRDCGFCKIHESSTNNWGRKLLFYKRIS